MNRQVDTQALIESLKKQLADEITAKHMYMTMLVDVEREKESHNQEKETQKVTDVSSA